MHKRIAASVLFTILLAIGGMLATVQPSQATTSCYMDNCVGKNPADTVCASDAKTIRAMDYHGEGMLEMRWSRICNATWTRFTVYWRSSAFNAGSQTLVCPQMSTIGVPYSPQGNIQNTWVPIGESYWTRMMSMSPGTVCSNLHLWGQLRDATGEGDPYYNDDLGHVQMCVS